MFRDYRSLEKHWFVLMCVLFGFLGCNRDREIQKLQTARDRAERRVPDN